MGRQGCPYLFWKNGVRNTVMKIDVSTSRSGDIANWPGIELWHGIARNFAHARDLLMTSVERVGDGADIQTVLERFLLDAMSVAGAQGGCFTLYEDGRYKGQNCVASSGAIVQEAEWREEVFFQEASALRGADLAEFHTRLITERITRDRVDELWSWWPSAARYHEQLGHKEVWNVACVANRTLVGIFGLGFASAPDVQAVGPILLEVSQEAALALEFNRLSVESEESAILKAREKAAEQRVQALAKANEALQATIEALGDVIDLDQIAPQVLGIAADIFHATSCAFYENSPSGTVWLRYWNVDGRTLTPAALIELDHDRFALVRRLAEGFKTPDCYLGMPTHEIGTAVVDHVQGTAVPEFDEFAVATGWDLELNIGVGAGKLRSSTLCIYRERSRPFLPEEITLAESLAKQLGLAVQFVRLADSSRELAVLREQDRATTAERTRLAREIHDTLAQSFSGIIVQIRAMQRHQAGLDHDTVRQIHADNALELASAGLTEARRSLASLRGAELEGRSLRQALTLMAQSTTKRSGIPVRVDALSDVDFGVQNEPELLRIVQESVTNAVKHSQATEIVIALRREGDRCDLCIEDNGLGFEPDQATEGFGILGMQERAARIGATIAINSSSSGTSICIQIGLGDLNAR